MGSPKNPDMYSNISVGNIDDHEVVNLMAYSNNLDTGALKIISGDMSIAQPAAEMQMSLISSDVADDGSPQGTGIGKVLIEYFNAAYEKKTEVVTLNGTTYVDTVATDIRRFNRVYNIESGSTGNAVGTITIVDKATRAILYANILPNRSFFERTLWYVEPGNIAVITDLNFSATTTSGTEFILFLNYDETTNGGGSVNRAKATAEAAYGTSCVFTLNMPHTINAEDWTIPRAFGIAARGLAADQDGSATLRFYEYTP